MDMFEMIRVAKAKLGGYPFDIGITEIDDLPSVRITVLSKGHGGKELLATQSVVDRNTVEFEFQRMLSELSGTGEEDGNIYTDVDNQDPDIPDCHPHRGTHPCPRCHWV